MSYVPGWTPDALAMMGGRRAATRAAFVLPHLGNGLRVLDVGCGPGTITEGLAAAVAPDGVVVGIDLARSQKPAVQASVYALPVRAAGVDVVFAHGLCEHLTELPRALAEFRRVLRTGGLLALSSSDWSGAVVEPRTAEVDRQLAAYLELRRTAGDPCRGGQLPDAVAAAGFTGVDHGHDDFADMSYADLASYIAARLGTDRWSVVDGVFTQRWVWVTARK